MPALSLALAHGRRLASVALFGRVRDALALHRQRRALERLEDRLLDDIGLDRDAAEAEARRPVWDVPRHWQR